MESTIEFVLKPVTGAAASAGGFRAIVDTAKGDALDFDDVITEALDRGYIAGVKDVIAKSVVKGVLDSMIAGVLRDGMTRRIGDYLSVSLKVHGRFEDAQEEFDPERHKLALSLKQLNEFRPSFKDVKATNINHKRQFRIYSVHSVGAEAMNRKLIIGRQFIIKGADFLSDSKLYGVVLHVTTDKRTDLSLDVPILSMTDREIKCAWPEDFPAYISDARGEVVTGREGESKGEKPYARRSIKVSISRA